MANQKIPVQIVRFFNALLPSPKYQHRIAPLTQSVIREDKLAENVALHSGLPSSTIVGLLAALPEAINDYMQAGNSVQLDGICTLKPYIKVDSHDMLFIETDDPRLKETVSARDIKASGVRAIPIGRMKSIVEAFQYEVLTGVVDEEEYDDEDVELSNP